MWDKVLELVGSAAPVVGTLLGGSAGNAVGELVARALGVENSPEAIEKELKNNPEAYLKLKELEVSKELAILKAQLENKVEDNRHVEASKKVIIEDKQDARDMYVETTKVTGKRDKAVVVLAAVIVIGFFAGLISLVFVHLDKGSGAYELLYMAFGALTMKFGTVVDFFFGASDK